MRNIRKFLIEGDSKSWAIRVVARPEINYPLEVVAYGNARKGFYDASFYMEQERMLLKSEKLAKGAQKTLPNNLHQAGLASLDTNEDKDRPLIKDGEEWMVLDGVHHLIEFAIRNTVYKLTRFHRQEEVFASIFNQVLRYSVLKTKYKDYLAKYLCTAADWDN